MKHANAQFKNLANFGSVWIVVLKFPPKGIPKECPIYVCDIHGDSRLVANQIRRNMRGVPTVWAFQWDRLSVSWDTESVSVSHETQCQEMCF